MTFHIALVAVGGSWVHSSDDAQEKYAVKIKDSRAGESWQFEAKTTTITTKRIPAEKDKRIKEETIVRNWLYTADILEKPPGAESPAKVKRVYQKAIMETIRAQEKTQTV